MLQMNTPFSLKYTSEMEGDPGEEQEEGESSVEEDKGEGARGEEGDVNVIEVEEITKC